MYHAILLHEKCTRMELITTTTNKVGSYSSVYTQLFYLTVENVQRKKIYPRKWTTMISSFIFTALDREKKISFYIATEWKRTCKTIKMNNAFLMWRTRNTHAIKLITKVVDESESKRKSMKEESWLEKPRINIHYTPRIVSKMWRLHIKNERKKNPNSIHTLAHTQNKD